MRQMSHWCSRRYADVWTQWERCGDNFPPIGPSGIGTSLPLPASSLRCRVSLSCSERTNARGRDDHVLVRDDLGRRRYLFCFARHGRHGGRKISARAGASRPPPPPARREREEKIRIISHHHHRQSIGTERKQGHFIGIGPTEPTREYYRRIHSA